MTGLVEDIKVIVKENEIRKLYIEDIDCLVDQIVSTVAVRIKVNDELYGQYTVIKKDTLTAQEVVEALNEMLKEMFLNGGDEECQDTKNT